MSLLANPINYVERSTNKIVGGSISFGINQALPSKYIDTTFLNVSVFSPSTKPFKPMTFNLIATFSDGSTYVLWSGTTTAPDVGETVTPDIYTFPDGTYCRSIVLSATNPVYGNNASTIANDLLLECDLLMTTVTPTYYYMLWDTKSRILVSTYQKPILDISPTEIVLSYDDTVNSDANGFIPLAIPITITNTVSDILTGDISWTIATTSGTATNNIQGIEISTATNQGITISVADNIYFNGTIYVTATNQSGLFSQEQLSLRLMNKPRIEITSNSIRQDFKTLQLPYHIADVASKGSGPIVWSITSANSNTFTLFPMTNTQGLSCTVNSFINDNVTISATNINGDQDTAQTHMLIANTPRLKTQQRFVTSLKDTVYTYSNLHQVHTNTGPVTWSILEGSKEGFSIASNTGLVQIEPLTYLNNYVVFGVSNLLGQMSKRHVFMNIVPTPYFDVQDIVVSLNPNGGPPYSTQYTLTTQQSLLQTKWSIDPSPSLLVAPNNMTFNTETGLLTIASNTVLQHVPYSITAMYTVAGANIGSISTKTVHISAANTPFLLNPGVANQLYGSNTVRATMSNNDVIIPLHQTSLYTGPVTWMLTDTSNLTIDDSNLAITNKTNTYAELRVKNDHPVNSNLRVHIVNNITGSTSNVAFRLVASQIPILITPPTLTSNITPSVVYKYQMGKLTSDNNITWYISSPQSQSPLPPELSIDSANGLITLSSNTVINRTIIVSASNIYGESSNTAPFIISVSQIPDFFCPPNIKDTLQDDPFRYSFVANTKDIVSWRVTGDNSASIETTTGLLTVTTSDSVNRFHKDLVVIATNSLGYSTSKTVNIDLIKPPFINAPVNTNIVHSITTEAYYQYQLTLQNNVTDVVQNTLWSMTSNTPMPYFTLNSNTGLLTFFKNNYYYGDIDVFTTSGVYGGNDKLTLSINVAQLPVLIQPNPSIIQSNLLNTQAFQYAFSNTALGTGPLTNWYYSPVFPGVDIDANGLLTLDPAYSINQGTVNVFVTNTAGGQSRSVNLRLTIGRTPILSDSNVIVGSSSYNSSFTYQFNQVTLGTGALTWTLLNGLPYPYPASTITISNTGLFTVVPNKYINTLNGGSPIRVRVENMLGSYCNLDFDLHVEQLPSFYLPPTIAYETNNSTSNYSIVKDPYPSGQSSATWTYSPVIDGITINPSTGLLNFQSNTYINCNITVYATNDINGVFSRNTQIIVAQKTVLTNPGPLTSNYGLNSIVYSNQIYYNSNTGTGPVTSWNVVNAATNASITNLRISSTGLLVYGATDNTTTSAPAISNIVTVSATNTIGSIATTNFLVCLTQTPNIRSPGNLSASMIESTDYTYSMSNLNVNSNNSGRLNWYIVNNPDTNLSINSNTGVLTYKHANYINRNITVGASNANGDTCNVTFNMNIMQSPKLIIPNSSNLIYSRPKGDPYTLIIPQIYSSNITRPLVWSISYQNNTPIPNMSITNYIDPITSSNNAIVTYGASNSLYNLPIRVVASNLLNSRDTINFNITVATNPRIANPGYVISTNLATGTPYKFQYSNQDSVPGETITWSIIYPTINGVYFNSTGQLTIDSDVSFNDRIVVAATNAIGYSNSISHNLTVTARPVVAPVPFNILNCSKDAGLNYTFRITNTDPRAKPLDWSYVNSSGFANTPGLSSNAYDSYCDFTLAAPFSLTDTLTITTKSRAAGLSVNNTYSIDIIRTPVIKVPINNVIDCNLTGMQTFSYPMQLEPSTSSYVGPSITWSLQNNIDPYLSINASTGVLTYTGTQNGTFINSLITVAATNKYNDVGTATFRLNVTKPDATISANNISLVPSSNYALLTWTKNGNPYLYSLDITNCNTSYKENTSDSSYIIQNLVPSTPYIFSITPLNSTGITGTPITLPTYTLPMPMSNLEVSKLSTSVSLSWNNTHYDYIDVMWNSIDDSIDDSIVGYCNNTKLSSPFIVTNILANRLYDFTVTPYNACNVPNTSQTIITRTLSDFGSNIITNVGTSNVNLTIYSKNNSYSNIQIGWSNILDPLDQDSIYLDYSLTSSCNVYSIGPLTSDNSYAFTIVSYNDANEPGVNSNTVFTAKSTLDPLIVTSSGLNNFTLNWVGKYTTVSVLTTTVLYNSDGTIQETQTDLLENLTVSMTSNPFVIYATHPDNDITIVVTSYNATGDAGQKRSIRIKMQNYVAKIYTLF